MGISNSIGSNTFDILLCLGLPWLIKASLTPAEPGHYWVRIYSNNIFFLRIKLYTFYAVNVIGRALRICNVKM